MLSLAFFLSGAAALLFETLWLRRAGLMLGSSVWASSIVLAAFMTGLAVGNAIAVRWAARIERPLRAYALLEIGAGVAGTAVVLAMPPLAPVLAPLFRALGDMPALANIVRLAIAFALVLLPTTAMGITLPVLTRALSRGDEDFGRVLGRLYGWNTLGGVMGAVAGELWLIARFGLRGTALAAAGLNLLAATAAWTLSHREAAAPSATGPAPDGGHDRGSGQRDAGRRSLALLAAAFVSGAALLGLEVVWFRFLQLFLFGTTLTFAFMLAVILAGIGGGGLAASLWLRRDPAAHRWLPAVAAAAALATTLGYALFSPWYRGAAFSISQPDATLVLALRLMAATSFASGALFTLQGAALRHELPGAGETAGRLTLVNTLGAMTGALGAGFVLLPALGMETSMFLLVALYGAAAALCRPRQSMPAARGARRAWVAALALLVLCVMLFPRGAMLTRHLPTSRARFVDDRTRVVALHEGVNQTTTLLRSEWRGEPVSYRLVTNGHSMSGTDLADTRYMKLFVNWAVAVNPRIRRALLISYGLGSTARALTDTRALTAIDVVDISPEILDLAPMMFATGDNPLGDPRVTVHVEDGRFFLQTTTASFDLITGEPPPPKAAGVVNLYSREYFRLLHDRLNDGGVATYWLPVEELDEDDARAVVSGFCAAFADCSLWTGAGPHWMLAGTRELRTAASEEAFAAQWRDTVVGPELARLGVEEAAQLGATFLADAEQLAPWIAGVAAVDDDHPQRLSPRRPHPARQDFIERWMDVDAAATRFARSTLIQRVWPPGLRERCSAFFPPQRLVNAVMFWPPRPVGLEDLRDVLADSTLRTLPVLVAGSSPILQDIAARAWTRGDRSPALDAQLAAGALARRDYAEASRLFDAAASAAPDGADARHARIYQTFALVMSDRAAEARAVLTRLDPTTTASAADTQNLRWLHAMLAEP